LMMVSDRVHPKTLQIVMARASRWIRPKTDASIAFVPRSNLLEYLNQA